LDEETLMSGNGAFAKANEILSVERALVEAARLNDEAIAARTPTEAWEAARIAWSFAAYVEALVKVRGT
jgi:hypothetical protein